MQVSILDKAELKRWDISWRLHEGAERTDSGWLFHREGAQEQIGFAPALVLSPGTDGVNPSCDLSEWDGGDMWPA